MQYIKKDDEHPEVIYPWSIYIILSILITMFICINILLIYLHGSFNIINLIILLFFLMIITPIIASDQFYLLELHKDKLVYKKLFRSVYELSYDKIEKVNFEYTREKFKEKRRGGSVIKSYNTCMLELSTKRNDNIKNSGSILNSARHEFFNEYSTFSLENNSCRLNLYCFTLSQKYIILKYITIKSNACIDNNTKQILEGDFSLYKEWMDPSGYIAKISFIIILAIIGALFMLQISSYFRSLL